MAANGEAKSFTPNMGLLFKGADANAIPADQQGKTVVALYGTASSTWYYVILILAVLMLLIGIVFLIMGALVGAGISLNGATDPVEIQDFNFTFSWASLIAISGTIMFFGGLLLAGVRGDTIIAAKADGPTEMWGTDSALRTIMKYGWF